MFTEFNEAGKPKTSLLRNSVKFNDFANPNCSWDWIFPYYSIATTTKNCDTNSAAGV